MKRKLRRRILPYRRQSSSPHARFCHVGIDYMADQYDGLRNHVGYDRQLLSDKRAMGLLHATVPTRTLALDDMDVDVDNNKRAGMLPHGHHNNWVTMSLCPIWRLWRDRELERLGIEDDRRGYKSFGAKGGSKSAKNRASPRRRGKRQEAKVQRGGVSKVPE